MFIRKLLPASLSKRLFVFELFRYQMAPVTRKQKISTSVPAVDESNTGKKQKISTSVAVVDKSKTGRKVEKKVSSKGRSKDQETGKDGLPMIPFPSQSDLEDWLKTNHTDTTGIWVKIAKKASGIPSVTYDQLIDVVLCFGWIDGVRCSFDETWFLQRITPRRAKSTWSQINREKVKRLIRIGKMQPAGQRLIDEAKVDGRWDNAYTPSSGWVVPDELVAAIEASTPSTIEMFRTLNKQSKLVLVQRLDKAISEDDRIECIKSIVEMMERGETVTE